MFHDETRVEGAVRAPTTQVEKVNIPAEIIGERDGSGEIVLGPECRIGDLDVEAI